MCGGGVTCGVFYCGGVMYSSKMCDVLFRSV